MLFVALRYTSYVQHQQLEEKRRQPQPPPPPVQQGGGGEGNGGFVVDPLVVAGRQEALGGEILAGEGVSLG